MANVFDQFDAQPQPGAVPNPFDQFDPPANVFDQFDSGPGFTTPFKAAARGLVEGTATAIQGVGIERQKRGAGVIRAFDAIDSGQPIPADAVDSSDMASRLSVMQYKSATPDEKAQMRAQAGAMGSTTQEVGKSVGSVAQDIPMSPAEQQSLFATVPETVGQVAPAIGAAAVTKGEAPGLLTAAGIFGSQMGTQQFNDALAHGADLGTAYNAFTGGVEIGGAMAAIPVGGTLAILDKLALGGVRRLLASAAITGGVGGVTGAGQQLLTNLQAKGLYDPQRGLSDGVQQAAENGTLAGILFGSIPTKNRAAGEGTPPAGEVPPPPSATGPVLPDHLMPSPGDVVGLNTRGGTPQRVTIDSVNGGHVFFTDEAGVKRGTTAADFSRDLTAAPEPKIDTSIISAAQPDRVLVRGEPAAPAVSAEAEAAPRPFDDDLFGLPGSEEVTPQGDGTADSPVIAQTAADVQRAADQTAVPTEAQKESGNYQKGHLDIQGLKIAIETPKDVDVYIGDHPEAPDVTVIDQVDPKTGRFDEHKALIGFDDPAKAIASYDAAFSDDSGPSRRSAAVTMPMDQFKEWQKSGKTKEPIGGQEAEPFQPTEEPGYFQKLKDEHTGISREAGYPDEDKLWQLPREDIDALSDRVNSQEETTERAIYGDDYNKVQKLYRKANSSWDISGADKAQAELDAYHDALPPEKKAMLDQYEQSNPGPHKDSVKVIQNAMRETEWTPDEPIENIAREAAYGLRQVTDPRKILDVPKGGASVEAQAAYIRINRGIKAMRERGVPAADIANRLVRGLEDQGFKHGDAGDFVHDFITESQSRFGGPKKIVDDVSGPKTTLRSEQWDAGKDKLEGHPGEWTRGTHDLVDFFLSHPDADRQLGALAWTGEKGNVTGFEYAAIVDSNGSVLNAGTSNNEGSVVLPSDVSKDPYSSPTRSIHHNHPVPSGLSVGDLTTLAFRSTAQITAVDSSGAIYAARRGPLLNAIAERITRTFGPYSQMAMLGARAFETPQKNLIDIGKVGRKALEDYLKPKIASSELTREQAFLVLGHAQGMAFERAGIIEYIAHIPDIGDLTSTINEAAGIATNAINEAIKNGSTDFRHTSFRKRAASSYQPAEPVRAEVAMAKIQEWSQGSAARQPASNSGPPRSEREASPTKLGTERGIEDEPLVDTIRAPDGRPATAAEIAVEASRLARMPRDSTLGKLRKTFSYVTLPVSLASKDRLSANLFGAVMDRFRRLNALENEAVPQASPYFRLKRPAMDRVNQVMEAARLYGLDLPDDGRSIVLQVPEERTPYGSPRPELSKPGQVLALSPEETAAYHSLKGFFQNRLTQMGEALARSRGYDGDFTREAIQAQMDAATAAGRRVSKSLSRAMQAFEMTEEMQRAGYVPFNRYGDYFVRVRPIDPASGDQGGLWFVPKQSVFQDVQVKMDGSNEQIPVREKVTELRRQYPADRFHIETGKTETLGGKNVLMTANIPQLEKIFMMLDRPGTDASAAILDDLMDKLFEARKAGFRKQAQNVRGYSTDFERSIADYIRQSSAHVSNMEHRNTIDTAKAQMDDHPDKNIRSFWDNYIRDLDTPDGPASQALRKVGFFQFIWGSFASAGTNILQTPGVTLPALAAWTGPRAPVLLGQALTEAAGAIRIGTRGFEIDWSKVGRTDAERAAIKRARQEGVMDPRMSEEAQGKNVTSSQRLRPYAKRMGHVWDAGASMFSTAESINRIAAWLSHFRAAQNPQLVETMARVFEKDQNFQRMRMAGGLTPEAIARFATEDTQFIGGKVNRAPITRGPGAWLLQFKPYLLNYLRIFHRMATRMGWRGQMAFSLGMGALVAQSGLFGLPYAQDVTDVGEWLYKQFTGIDPMIEARIKQAASDSAMGPLGGELVGHGLGRLGPVDISNRTSMGQIVPSGNPMDLFPLASGTVGRSMQFWNEMSQGRPWTAWAGASGLVIGKGGEDIAKAAALSKEGYATQKGNVVEFPSQVTNSQLAARGLGFQPSDLSKELEQRTEANRMKESTTAASSKLLTDVSRELALAQDATRSGDKATADQHYARYSALIKANAAQLADPSIPMWQKVPPIQARAIKAAVKQQIDYENSVLSRTSKLKRGAVQSIQGAP